MAEIPPCHFIKVETSLLFFFVKSQKISRLQSMSLSVTVRIWSHRPHRPSAVGLNSLSHFTHMNRLVAILFLGFSVFLTGCTKRPDVRYLDLSPATTATVSGDTVTIHLGSDTTASACWTYPMARVEGKTVRVKGYRTFREESRELLVRLPAAVSPQTVTVVWVDPDGSKVSVPVAK